MEVHRYVQDTHHHFASFARPFGLPAKPSVSEAVDDFTSFQDWFVQKFNFHPVNVKSRVGHWLSL
jgi:hypothetical protein